MERLSQPLSSAANKAFLWLTLGESVLCPFFTTQSLRIEKQLKSMFLLLICDKLETTSDHFFQSFSIILVLGRRRGHYFMKLFSSENRLLKRISSFRGFFQPFSSWARVFENWKLRATVQHSVRLPGCFSSQWSYLLHTSDHFYFSGIFFNQCVLWCRTRMGKYVKCSSWERCQHTTFCVLINCKFE